MSRTKLVIGNWKMNGALEANSARLQAVLAGAKNLRCTLAVCSPAPYLAQCQQLLKGSNVAWGAQDCSDEAQGAFTGETAAAMIAEFGARYCLVGHSERRARWKESDACVVAKAARALAAGLTPVLCVGETLQERQANETEAVVGRQLSAAAALFDKKIVVAYEPVWAIGTGLSATPEQAQAVHAFLRQVMGAAGAVVPILYGGSVNAGNAASLFAQRDIDGGLIGGAALKAEDFLAIARAADAA